MGNFLTNTLPPTLDNFLMDMCQMYCEDLGYNDVIAFSKRITDEDLKALRRLYRKAKEASEYNDEDELAEIAVDVEDLVKGKAFKESKKPNKRSLKENHEWKEFGKFENSDKYLPSYGDGDSKGSQAATALSKLVYKWFNDGDVYDNEYALKGWANDISGSANWLYKYIEGSDVILDRIETICSEDEYKDLLYDLCAVVDPQIPSLLRDPKVGDAYDEDGPFNFYDTCEDCGQVMPNGAYCDGVCYDCYCEREAQWEEEDRWADDEDNEEEF